MSDFSCRLMAHFPRSDRHGLGQKNHQTLALEKEQVPQREDCMK